MTDWLASSSPDQAPQRTHLRDWSHGVPVEPLIRIGIVLDEDVRGIVRAQLGEMPARVYEGAEKPALLLPGTALGVRWSPGSLALTDSQGAQRRGDCLRIELPPASRPTAQTGLVLRDVPAGRGFHWQKCIDQVLPGTVEMRPGRHGVIVINEVPLETYLAGVISAEMSGDCPSAFLQAQCICARSWLLANTEAKHADQPFDRCNDDCCQRYQGMGQITQAVGQAVNSTRGVVLVTGDGRIVDANYAKCCGGISEKPIAVWGVAKPGVEAVIDAPPSDPLQQLVPLKETHLDTYLAGDWLRRTRAYCSPAVVGRDALARYLGRVDEVRDYFRWSVRYSADELVSVFVRKSPEMADVVAVRDLRIAKRGVSGRALSLTIDWQGRRGRTRQTTVGCEYDIRASLHPRFLLSSAFQVDPERDSTGNLSAVTLRGAGWGHGVGLCQMGALGMALAGQEAALILQHYFPAARQASVYS